MKLTKKIISAVLLLALALTAVFTLAACGTEQPAPQAELQQQEEFVQEFPDVMAADGTELVSQKVYPMAANMTFSRMSALSETAKNGITIEATPNATTAVDWEVAWAEDANAWYNGLDSVKQDPAAYIEVTPKSDGALTATVKCLAEFGRKIKIVVTARSNTGVKATCTLDYLKRIEEWTVTPGEKFVFSDTGFNDIAHTITWGVGTIQPTMDNMQFNGSQNLINVTYPAIFGTLAQELLNEYDFSNVTLQNQNKQTVYASTGLSELKLMTQIRLFVMNYFNHNSSDRDALIALYTDKVIKAANEGRLDGNQISFALSLTVTYGDISYTHEATASYTKYDVSGLTPVQIVTEITLNPSGYVF